MRYLPCLVVCSLCLLVPTFAAAQIPIKKVTASSFQAPNVPTNTLSNDTTRWSAKGKGQWIQYEFAFPWTLLGGHFTWLNHATRATTFTVQVSKNGSTWTTLFHGPSEISPWATGLDFSPPFAASFVRIVGRGNTANAWNSLEFVQWFGTTDHYGSPVYNPWDIYPPLPIPYEDAYLIDDYQTDSALMLPANDAVFIQFEGGFSGPSPVACVALFWAQPVSFVVQQEVFDADGNDVFETLIQAEQHEPALRVYSVDPTIPQDPSWRVFGIAPLGTDAALAEARLLRDCNENPGPTYASSVTASSWQLGTTNVPGNTLDTKPATRWSAEGEGQWIAYELLEQTYRAIGIQWYKGPTRTAFFDLEMSLDGAAWYPVLVGGESRQTSTLEWYTFPPAYGSFMRIVGYGTSVNAWNSITEVRFGVPQAVNVAAQ